MLLIGSFVILSLAGTLTGYRFGVVRTKKKYADIILFGPLWRDALKEIAQIVGVKGKSLRAPVIDMVMALKSQNCRLINILKVVKHSLSKKSPIITKELVEVALRREA